MKNLHDIRQEIQPTLRQIEKHRIEKLEAISKAKKWYIIPVTLLILALLSGLGMLVPMAIIFGVLAIVGFLLVGIFKVSPHKKGYINSFKEEVFSTFVQSLYPDTYYAPGNYLPSTIFSASQLFGGYDSYDGSDYFEGKTENGCAFKFSEINATSTTRDSDGDSRTTTVFNGVFFVLSVPNRVTGRIQVLPDSAESSMGFLGKLVQKSLGSLFQGGTMVYMQEHPEFEKEFVVYSKDPEEAYRVLTPAMIQAIYDLRYKWNKKLRVSFIDNQIYVALSSTHDYFHPDINKSVLDDNFLDEFYDELALCFAVVEDMSIEHTGTYNPPREEEETEKPQIYTKRKANDGNPFLL
jgi:hypothetical protein